MNALSNKAVVSTDIDFNLIAISTGDLEPGFESYAMDETFMGAVANLIHALQEDGVGTYKNASYYYTLEDDGYYRFYTDEMLLENNIWINITIKLHGGLTDTVEGIYNMIKDYVYEVSIRGKNYEMNDIKEASAILPTGEIVYFEVDEYGDFVVA